MNSLTKVLINNTPYFIDLRLKEYRAVDNPHDRIAFVYEDDEVFLNKKAGPFSIEHADVLLNYCGSEKREMLTKCFIEEYHIGSRSCAGWEAKK